MLYVVLYNIVHVLITSVVAVVVDIFSETLASEEAVDRTLMKYSTSPPSSGLIFLMRGRSIYDPFGKFLRVT